MTPFTVRRNRYDAGPRRGIDEVAPSILLHGKVFIEDAGSPEPETKKEPAMNERLPKGLSAEAVAFITYLLGLEVAGAREACQDCEDSPLLKLAFNKARRVQAEWKNALAQAKGGEDGANR